MQVKRKAREMGKKTRQERYWNLPFFSSIHDSLHFRLREIEMSEHDADLYAKTLGKVRNQVQALQTMLSSIEVIHAMLALE